METVDVVTHHRNQHQSYNRNRGNGSSKGGSLGSAPGGHFRVVNCRTFQPGSGLFSTQLKSYSTVLLLLNGPSLLLFRLRINQKSSKGNGKNFSYPIRIDIKFKDKTLKNYNIDGNKEMIAFGMMNIAGSCTSCYLATGPFSRSAVNFNAGCKTAVSNIVMAFAVMLTLLFLIPLFHYTPLVVLSSIIIAAMLGLIDYEAAIHLWKIDNSTLLSA